MLFEKWGFSPQIQILPVLKQESISKRPFDRKDSLAHYLSYTTLVTYIPVLRAE